MKEGITPVLLLTGYLGSGKTTLLNNILRNERGIRFAVIVNDIGEVNIDETLIRKEGIVGNGQTDDLVALQNGCICCTLKMDLIKQLAELVAMRQFDYIVIEASGICEPAPIAQTISAMSQIREEELRRAMPRLDCICTVVDALRLRDEFGCGRSLKGHSFGEDDIENLIIDQIEFCNVILLNKISEVTADEAAAIKVVIRALQPSAKIIECDYCDVDLSELVNTRMFDFEQVANSATWVQKLTEQHHDDDDDHEDDHEEHHHHHHGEGEALEYGISTFVYFRRRPFNFEKFDRFLDKGWPRSVIRCKGVIYFSQNRAMSLLFEQAGRQKSIKEAGLWYAEAPENELQQLMAMDPGFANDWDEQYGDRMEKLVFIGRDMDRHAITEALDACLE